MKKIVCVLCSLLVVVSPFVMAVPADAASVSGDGHYWEASITSGPIQGSILGDQFAESYVFFVSMHGSMLQVGYYFSDKPLAVAFENGGLHFATTDFLAVCKYYHEIPYPLDLRGCEPWVYGVVGTDVENVLVWGCSGNVDVSGDLDAPLISLVYHAYPGTIKAALLSSSEFIRGFIGMLGASAKAFLNHSVLMLFIFAIPLSMGAVVLVRGLIKKRKR